MRCFDITILRCLVIAIWQLNRENEVVPISGAAFLAKDFLVESAARRGNALFGVGCQRGNILWLDAGLDKQADAVVLIAHIVETV